MRRFIGFASVAFIVAINLLLAITLVSGEEAKPHWTYEGEEGAEHWGDLDPSFALCGTGRAQSPIDVSNATTLDLANITFDYQPSAMNILNNGHTIQVNYDAGSFITYNESTYQLLQFHFHHPSEHTINGEHAAMEVHFVHADDKGNLAVVGVLLTEDDTDNTAYAPIFENLPATASDPQAIGTLLASDLLPATQTFYTYSGSLTTPPCSQGVRWLLLTEPVALSGAQIASFASIFELNARPVQPLNTRDLLQDSQ